MSTDDDAIQIPETMKRLVLTQPGATVDQCKFEVETVPVPKLEPGEVLIKVAASAVNPSDYGVWVRASPDQCPKTCGSEGCGVVVMLGPMGFMSNLMLRLKVGSKVGFVRLPKGQGTYSEYVVASASNGVFPLPDSLPVEEAASFFVNPYTTLAILGTAQEAGSKALVHTAAASQLGQMMVKLAPSEGMEVINLVRRKEQAELLQGLGAKHVVVTADDNWKDELKAKIKELEATVAFDAVAGKMTGDLLDVLPKKGTCYVYGGLAGAKVENVNPMELIYKEKKVHGFLVSHWISKGGMLWMIPRMLTAGQKVNAGLQDGWSKTQFQDTTMEKMQKDLVALLNGTATGRKLRLRFP